MAYLNICGWETGDITEAVSSSGTFSIQTTTKRTGAYGLQVNPAGGATGFVQYRKHFSDGTKTTFGVATIYHTFYFRAGSIPSAEEQFLETRADGSSLGDTYLTMTAGGVIKMFKDLGAFTLVATGTTVLSTGTWYRLDYKLGTGATGAYELKINGVSEFSGTTDFGTSTIQQDILFGNVGRGSGTSAVNWYFDDWAASDSAYPGAGQVNILKPNGAGNYTAWTGTYADVDEVPHDSDTTYLASSTATQAETAALESAATGGVSGTIGTVKSVVIVRDEAGVSSLNIRTRSNTTDQDTTAVDPGATYVLLGKLNDADPATSAAWTSGGLDALEVGVLNNDAVAVRCTALYAMVWSTGSNPQTVTPTTAALVTATFAPTTRLNMLPTPSTLATVLASFAPTILNPQGVTPATLATLLAAFAPSVTVGQNVTPGVASLLLAQFTPTVINPMSATPTTLALVLSAFAPSVSVGQSVTPDTLALLMASFAPLILLPNVVTPGLLALVISLFTPTAPVGYVFTPTPGALVTATFAPTIPTTANFVLTPATAALVLVTFAPVILIPNIGWPRPQAGIGRFVGPNASSSGRLITSRRGVGRFFQPPPGTGR